MLSRENRRTETSDIKVRVKKQPAVIPSDSCVESPERTLSKALTYSRPKNKTFRVARSYKMLCRFMRRNGKAYIIVLYDHSK